MLGHHEHTAVPRGRERCLLKDCCLGLSRHRGQEAQQTHHYPIGLARSFLGSPWMCPSVPIWSREVARQVAKRGAESGATSGD